MLKNVKRITRRGRAPGSEPSGQVLLSNNIKNLGGGWKFLYDIDAGEGACWQAELWRAVVTPKDRARSFELCLQWREKKLGIFVVSLQKAIFRVIFILKCSLKEQDISFHYPSRASNKITYNKVNHKVIWSNVLITQIDWEYLLCFLIKNGQEISKILLFLNRQQFDIPASKDFYFCWQVNVLKPIYLLTYFFPDKKHSLG